MRSSGRPARVVRAGLVAALVAGAVVAQGGTAGAAPLPQHETLGRSSWLTIDSRSPHHNTTTGDARVGSWRDAEGKRHTGKSYFTFDLTKVRDATVFAAAVTLAESAANDCAKPRATELWLVKPSGTVTWARQPRELVRLAGPRPATGCVAYVTWDLADAVRDTLAEGSTTLTVVARISGDFQGDTAYGRTYRNSASLDVDYNHSPARPSGLKVDNTACAGEPLITAARQPVVSATFADPDGVRDVEARMAFWPVSAPDQRREVFPVWAGLGYASTYFPPDMLQDDNTYAWAVRAEDGHATSEWSEPCLITVDHTAPAVAPTVTSPVYQEDGGPPGNGGEGVPGEFTFGANGVADVVAFEYDGIGMPYGRVEADRPGGSATVSLTPTSNGPLSITVVGLDRAGNRSPGRTFRFWVRDTSPSVEGQYSRLGRSTEFTLTARQDGAVTATYRLDDGLETTVPLGPDGTAKTTVAFDRPEPEFHRLDVWTTDANGRKSGVAKRVYYVDAMKPDVSVTPWDGLVGQERTFFFSATMPDAVSFTYRVDDGPEATVPVGADGTAQVTYAPRRSGWSELFVFTTNAAGVRSGNGSAEFAAESVAPTVTSAEYPEWTTSGGPGVRGTFTLSTRLAGVAEYRYAVADGPERTVGAGADGRASFDFTPTKPGYVRITAWAVSGSGIVSDETTYVFYAGGLAPVITSPQFPPGTNIGGRVGEPVEFTFTAALTGSTEYAYRFNDDAETVVAAGPDGRATVTFTPPTTGVFVVRVLSRTPEGYVSATAERYFSVQTA